MKTCEGPKITVCLVEWKWEEYDYILYLFFHLSEHEVSDTQVTKTQPRSKQSDRPQVIDSPVWPVSSFEIVHLKTTSIGL